MVTQTDLNAAVLAASTSAADAATFAREAEDAATTSQTNQVTITTLVNSALTCENNASYDAGQAKSSAEHAAFAAGNAATSAIQAQVEADRARSEADRAAGIPNAISLPIDGGTDITRSSISMDRLAFSIDSHVGNSNYTNLNTTQINGRDIEPERVKAWVNLNGRGTIALLDSFNIASSIDNGTGDYSVSFTNSMASYKYQVSVSSEFTNSVDVQNFMIVNSGRVKGATGFTFAAISLSSATTDTGSAHSAVQGDLA